MNDHQFRVARLKGEFVWHMHATTDEAFIVVEGQRRIDFRDGAVTPKEGEMFVAPKDTEHKPYGSAYPK